MVVCDINSAAMPISHVPYPSLQLYLRQTTTTVQLTIYVTITKYMSYLAWDSLFCCIEP